MATYGADHIRYYQESEFNNGSAMERKQSYSLNLTTIHLAGLHLLLSMSIFIAGIYLELQWLTEENCQTYFVMIYLRMVFWVATFVIDILVTQRHNELRRQGYHEFYRKKILTYKNAPFAIVTLWNMVIFLVQTITLEYYGNEFSLHCQKGIQSPITYVCVFCGFETMLLMIVHGTYIMKVYHFNNIHSLPDALRDMEQPFIGSLGITIENGKVADLLEKQADLIYYLKEHNFNLKRKLLQLSKQSRTFGSYQKI